MGVNLGWWRVEGGSSLDSVFECGVSVTIKSRESGLWFYFYYIWHRTVTIYNVGLRVILSQSIYYTEARSIIYTQSQCRLEGDFSQSLITQRHNL